MKNDKDSVTMRKDQEKEDQKKTEYISMECFSMFDTKECCSIAASFIFSHFPLVGGTFGPRTG